MAEQADQSMLRQAMIHQLNVERWGSSFEHEGRLLWPQFMDYDEKTDLWTYSEPGYCASTFSSSELVHYCKEHPAWKRS